MEARPPCSTWQRACETVVRADGPAFAGVRRQGHVTLQPRSAAGVLRMAHLVRHDNLIPVDGWVPHPIKVMLADCTVRLTVLRSMLTGGNTGACFATRVIPQNAGQDASPAPALRCGPASPHPAGLF